MNEWKEIRQNLLEEYKTYDDLMINEPIDSDKRKLYRELKDDAWRRLIAVNDIIENDHERYWSILKIVGQTALSFGANALLIILAGRMEFVEGRLIPSFARVSIPVGGQKI